jgi:hypothetical protein
VTFPNLPSLQALVPSGPERFPPTSRYHGLETATLPGPDGRPIVHLRRRFLPPLDRFALLQLHTVVEGDRPDTLAAQYLGDPEQFWRLCDANNVLHPDELTMRPGRSVRVTLPEGIPGPGRE